MAVYTDITEVELGDYLRRYDIGELLSYKGIAEGSENSNFLLHTGAGSFILTLYEKRVERADLPFFLGLMEHLARKGLTCPLPVRQRDGSVIGEIAGRPSAVITFLEGMWPRRPTAAHCRAVGEALARMHIAGRDFEGRRDNALALPGWKRLWEMSRDRADEVEPGLADEIEADFAVFERDWPADLPSGVIHADLFPDNVLMLGDRVTGLIDFYFAASDFRAYDLVITHASWAFSADGKQCDPARAEALMRGYAREITLSDAEVAALPLLARGASLRFLLTRAHDWVHTPADALVTRKDPSPFLARLQRYSAPDAASLFAVA